MNVPNIRHFPSGLSTTFSEAVTVGASEGEWILLAGTLGVPLQAGSEGETDFEQEVRACFDRLQAALDRCGAKLSDLVRLDIHLTDLSLYGTLNLVRAELFPANPPASTAVEVAGLLLGARVEIGGMAFISARAYST